MSKDGTSLQRHLGFFALLIYGVGDILGAGIYALIGPVSKAAGSWVWLSFVIALSVAFLTALGYSEMTSRFPKSGGVAYFAHKAFKSATAGFMAGWLLLFVSIVSMATLTRAFSGYLNNAGVELPLAVIVIGFLSLVGLINYFGIKHSSVANIVSTGVEFTGLLIVLVAGAAILKGGGAIDIGTGTFTWSGVLAGAALAFYAFIGFEDLANVAEEVKRPKRNLPRAILGSIGIAGSLYLAIGWLATATVPIGELGTSSAALKLIVDKSPLPVPSILFTVIALFAVTNTCLINSITGSRLLYGLAQQGLIPRMFGKLNRTRQTPHVAIGAVLIAAGSLATLGSLSVLAGATSVLILLVFSFTNLALLKVKTWRKTDDHFTVPPFIPIVAIAANLILIAASTGTSIAIAAAIIAIGFILNWLNRQTDLAPSALED